MTTTSTMIHIQVDEKIQIQATKTLSGLGLSVSDAVRVFLERVATDQQLPFALSVPNAETRAAMAEADLIADRHQARFHSGIDLIDDLEKNARQ